MFVNSDVCKLLVGSVNFKFLLYVFFIKIHYFVVGAMSPSGNSYSNREISVNFTTLNKMTNNNTNILLGVR